MILQKNKNTDLISVAIDIFEYLLIFFIILSGASMYSAMQVHHFSNSFFGKCSMLAGAGLIFLYLLKYRRIKCTQKTVAMACLLVMHNLTYIIVTRYQIGSFVINFMMMLYIYIVLCILWRNTSEGYYRIVKKYCNLVIIIAGISLFFYFFGTILNVIPGASITRYNKMNIWFTCRSYYNIYFEAQEQIILGKQFIRNCGIFMEAPGFAMPLTLSLLYELFNKQPPRKWVCVILTVTGLTTLSTKVFITMAVLYMLYFFTNEKKKSSFIQVMKILITPLILVATAIFIYYALQIKVDENENSFLGRMDSLQATMKVWMHHPLFGSGFKNDDSIREYYTYITSKYNGITAGFTCILAQGGIWMMTAYLYAIYQLYRNAQNMKQMRVFLVIYFIYWFQSSIQYSPFMLMILAMGTALPVLHKVTISDILERLRLTKNTAKA